jgi:hypothetical protein
MGDLKPDTLDFVFEYTRGAPEVQLKDVEALDSKALQVLGAASVIIGLSGVSGTNRPNLGSAILLALALLAYILVAIAVFGHIRAQLYRRGLQADDLWRKSWKHDVLDVKHAIVTDIAEAYAHNKCVIEHKRKSLAWSLRFAVAEVLLVGGSLLASRL